MTRREALSQSVRASTPHLLPPLGRLGRCIRARRNRPWRLVAIKDVSLILCGARGQVYKGQNQETMEAVAIKEVSLIRIRKRSPEFIARHQKNLQNETECLLALDHPNMVSLLGAAAASTLFYKPQTLNPTPKLETPLG